MLSPGLLFRRVFSPLVFASKLGAGALLGVAFLLGGTSGSAYGQQIEGPEPAPKKALNGWSGIFQPPGIDGDVYATATHGDKLYVGGDFEEAGGVDVDNLAVWNRKTQQWSATVLEIDPSSSGEEVWALAVGPDGRLYVGGDFQPIGVTSPNLVSLKDGTVQEVGGGLYLGSKDQGTVHGLLVHQGDLYAAGLYSETDGQGTDPVGFARWTGSGWEAPGNLMVDGSPGRGRALGLDGSGQIVVGGTFDEAGPTGANNIARWDPDDGSWDNYDEGVLEGDGVFAITRHEHQEFGSEYLYIGGDFSAARTGSLNNLAYWDGTEWNDAGGGVSGRVYALEGGPSKLRVGGDFSAVGANDEPASDVAVFTTSWSTWGGGTGQDSDISSVRTIVAESGNAFVGGDYTLAGDPDGPDHRKANGLAWWDETASAWNALGKGIERGGSDVEALVASGKTWYVGGSFDYAGGVLVNHVAKWSLTDKTWQALDDGVSANADFHEVAALALDGSGNLYVGGEFEFAGGGPADNVAMWDGTFWTELGGGTDGRVSALATQGGRLYAGGEFSSPGQNIALWDGGSWSSLGGGTNDGVYALTLLGTDLYVGGSFTQAGGQSASMIARWDGSAWSEPGDGVNFPVRALESTPFDEVYVGGAFTKAGGETVNHVARWYKGGWHSVGYGTDGTVRSLEYSGECQLYAGGRFENAGGDSAGQVAAWNGASWSSFSETFGPGTSIVKTLSFSDGELFAGGNFDTVTNSSGTEKVSVGIAQWGGGFPGGSPATAIDLFEPDESTLYYAAPESLRVDLSGASGVDSVDFAYSMDGGGTWTTIDANVLVSDDSASTTWQVPDSTSASELILRVEASANPCLSTEKTYDYLDHQDAGDKVTHIYRYSNHDEYFDPDKHGYPFANDSAGVWPELAWPDYSHMSGYFRTVTQAEPSSFPSWFIFCDAAGDAFCYYPAPLTVGTKWPRQHSALVWRVLSQAGDFPGACVGFATTSLLAFENNSTVLNDLGLNSNGLVNSVGRISGRRPIAKYHTRQYNSETLLAIVSKNGDNTPTETLKQVREMLGQKPGSGRELRYLSIWTLGKPRSQINFDDPSQLANLEPAGHALVPYRVEQDPDNEDIWYIYVYDNNHPGNNQTRITINKATDSWDYPDSLASGQAWGASGQYAGLFLSDKVGKYVGPRPVKQAPDQSAYPAGSDPPRKIRFASDTHVRMLATRGTQSTIRNADNQSIGFEEGVVVNDMRGEAIPLLAHTGSKERPYGFVVPEDRSYTAEMSGFPRDDFFFSVEEESTMYAFGRSGASQSETDRYHYGAEGFGVANPSSTTKTYQARAILSEPERERAFSLKKLKVAPSEGDYLTINRSDSTLLVTNQGDSTGFNLDLRRLNDETGKATFLHSEVLLPENARLRIVPDWTELPGAPVTVLVDNGIDGTIDEELSLSNEDNQLFGRMGESLNGVWTGSSNIADVDRDGNADLLITGDSESGLSATLYLGDGGGAFTQAETLTGVKNSSSSIAEVNGDGNPDLLITGRGAEDVPSTKLYFGDGTGTFTEAGVDLVDVGISASSIADFNRDGAPDLFVTGLDAGGGKTAKLYLGEGQGDFTEAGADIDGTMRGSSSVADVNGDGNPDLLVTGENGGIWSATLYLGDGDGGFTKANAGLTGVLESSSAIGDVNKDGNPDLLISGRDENREHVSILYLGDGAGEFSEATRLLGVDVNSSNIADVDGDGNPDLLITGRDAEDEPTATLYLGDGSGNFTEAGAGLTGVYGSSSNIADLDGDYDPDLLITGYNSSFEPSARIYEQTGEGRSPSAEAERTVEDDGTVEFGTTGIRVNFQETEGQGAVRAEKFGDGPADRGGITTSNVSSYLFQIQETGDLSFGSTTEVRFAVDDLAGVSNPETVTVYTRETPTWDRNNTWVSLPTSFDTEANELVVQTGHFSQFALGADSDPLPVELSGLNAALEDKTVRLMWETSSETNSARFEIERKAGADREWERVGVREGAGTTSETQRYRFVDGTLPFESDRLRYRLRQVDTDGSVHLSEVVSVQQGVEEVQLRPPHPNPVHGRATIRYALPDHRDVSIHLYDVLGRRVRTLVQEEKSGRHEARLDVVGLSSGVYFLRLQAKDQTRTEQLTVLQ